MNEQNNGQYNGYQPPQGNGYPPQVQGYPPQNYPPQGYSQQGQGYPQQDSEYYQQPNGPYGGQPYYQQPYMQTHQPQKKTSPLVKGCGIGCAGLIGIIALFALLPSTDNDDDVDTYTPPETTTTTIAAIDDSDDWFLDSSEPEEDSDERSEDTTTAETTAPPETTTPDETITEETTATEISLAIPSEVSDFSWTGSTDDVLSGLHVEGYAALELSYSGEGIFSVETHGADDRLLSIALGPYTGTVLIDKTGDYDIEIKADGPWEISAHEIEQHNDGYLHPGDTISGHGDYVSKAFIPLAHKYQVFYTGKDLFSAELHDVSFSDRDLLVMEAGSYTGTVYSELWGICFLEIKSDGDWTIELLE